MRENNTYTDIYIVRHGIPNYEKDCLTDEGKIEAEETSKFLSKVPFDIIFSSTQGRAIETAQPTADKLGLKINLLPWATENMAAHYMSADRHDGHFYWCFSIEEYNKKFDELKYDVNWFDDPFFENTKFKEGILFYKKEVREWLASLNLKYNEQTNFYEKTGDTPSCVALFAHGGMASQTIPTILGINYPLYVTNFAHLDTCAYTIIRIWHNSRSILLKHNVKPIKEFSFKEMKN